MYKCPNCDKVFEPSVYGTRAGEPFIRCPECGLNRALESDVWCKNAPAPSGPTEGIGDAKLQTEKPKTKAAPKKKAPSKTKKSKKK